MVARPLSSYVQHPRYLYDSLFEPPLGTALGTCTRHYTKAHNKPPRHRPTLASRKDQPHNQNKAPEFSCAENHFHSFVPSPRASPSKKILQWEARHLVVLRNGVQQRVTLRLDVDRCHALYRVLDAHLVVNHLRLHSEGDEVRLEASVRKGVFVLAVLKQREEPNITRDKREKNSMT